MKVRILLR
jgi:hypothetical protein